MVQVGNLPGGQIPVPANAVMAKEIDLRGSFRFGTEFFTAVELIADGSVDVLSLVTAQRPLSCRTRRGAAGARPLAKRQGRADGFDGKFTSREIAHDAAGMAVVRAQ